MSDENQIADAVYEDVITKCSSVNVEPREIPKIKIIPTSDMIVLDYGFDVSEDDAKKASDLV
jgi:hypothetical protein